MNPKNISFLLGILLFSCELNAQKTDKNVKEASDIDDFEIIEASDGFEAFNVNSRNQVSNSSVSDGETFEDDNDSEDLEENKSLVEKNDDNVEEENESGISSHISQSESEDATNRSIKGKDDQKPPVSPITVPLTTQINNTTDPPINTSNLQNDPEVPSIKVEDVETESVEGVKDESVKTKQDAKDEKTKLEIDDKKVKDEKAEVVRVAVGNDKPEAKTKVPVDSSDSANSSKSSNSFSSDEANDNLTSQRVMISVGWCLLTFSIVGTIILTIVLVYFRYFKSKKSTKVNSKKVKDEPPKRVTFADLKYTDFGGSSGNLKARSVQTSPLNGESIYPTLPKDLV